MAQPVGAAQSAPVPGPPKRQRTYPNLTVQTPVELMAPSADVRIERLSTDRASTSSSSAPVPFVYPQHAGPLYSSVPLSQSIIPIPSREEQKARYPRLDSVTQRSFDPPTQITDYLFLGSKGAASDRECLSRLGITHVLNMAQELDNVFENDARGPRIMYERANIVDRPFQPLFEFLPQGIRFIDMAASHPQKQCKVLVHCAAGVSRSAAMVIAWVMYADGLRMLEALDVVKRKHQQTDPYNFYPELQKFEEFLEKRGHYTDKANAVKRNTPFRPRKLANKKECCVVM